MQMKLGGSGNELGVAISVELVGIVWTGISSVIVYSYPDLRSLAPILQDSSWYQHHVQLGGLNKSCTCRCHCSTISTQMEVIWWVVGLMITLLQVQVLPWYVFCRVVKRLSIMLFIFYCRLQVLSFFKHDHLNLLGSTRASFDPNVQTSRRICRAHLTSMFGWYKANQSLCSESTLTECALNLFVVQVSEHFIQCQLWFAG